MKTFNLFCFFKVIGVFLSAFPAFAGIANDVPVNPKNVEGNLVRWSSNMNDLPLGTKYSVPPGYYCSFSQDTANGLLKLEGSNPQQGGLSSLCGALEFGRTIVPSSDPYFRIRIRITKGAYYYIRPFNEDKAMYPAGSANPTAKEYDWSFIQPAMEARTGTWDEVNDPNGGWEELTFNLDTYTKLFNTSQRQYDRIWLEVYPSDSTAQYSYLHAQIDDLTIHRGIQPAPDKMEAAETNFHDGLDNDGNGKVDRDDPGFSLYQPKVIMPIYQTQIWYSRFFDPNTKNLLYEGRWAGYKRPRVHVFKSLPPGTQDMDCLLGKCAECTFINPETIVDSKTGKRAIMATNYPLDYQTIFSTKGEYAYDVAAETGKAYDEHADQTASGIWTAGGAGKQSPAPTNQFNGTLKDFYKAFGAYEEYDLLSTQWVSGAIKLAHAFGANGFAVNDMPELENYIVTFCKALRELNSNTLLNDKFFYAPYYAFPSGGPERTAGDLRYIMGTRPEMAEFANTLQYRGKPVLFITPTEWDRGSGVMDSVYKWNETCRIIQENGVENLHGLFTAPNAVPDTDNILRFRFDKYRDDSVGAVAARIDDIILLDKDMNEIEVVDLGTTQARAQNLNTVAGDPAASGWSDDLTIPGVPPYNIIYTRDNKYGDHGRPRSLMNLHIPKEAKFLKVKILPEDPLPYSATAEPGGSQPQWVEMSIFPANTAAEVLNNPNTADCGIRFSIDMSGWVDLTFRLSNLPEGFDMHGHVASTSLSELPMSLWGDVPPFVNRYDRTGNYTSGFEGYASYVSGDRKLMRDARTLVNYPYLQAGTVQPGFDDSGFFYNGQGETSQPYYRDPQNGKRLRREFETMIRCGADMILLTSWNEWFEGTNMEPDIERGFQRVRLMLTYALLYRDQLATAKWPSETDLTMWRYDRLGKNRKMKFTIAGDDTVTFRNLPLSTSPNLSVKRNGAVVSPGLTSGARWALNDGNLAITETTTPTLSTWEISYDSNDFITLSPGEQNVPASGGTYPLAITTGFTNCEWKAASNSAWITINSANSGTGSGSIQYTVDSNPTFAPRTGTVTVGVETHTITQMPPDFGAVRVSITPQDAVTSGARWRLDSGSWQDSGTTQNNVLTGTHTISFLPMEGWDTPADIQIGVSNGVTATANTAYTRQYGSLTVTLSGPANGAAWSIDGGATWQTSGQQLNPLMADTYTVTFKPVSGWVTPAPRQAVVTKNTLAQVTVFYQPTLKAALDNSSVNWTTAGNASWFGQTDTSYYGNSAAQSGSVGNDGYSELNGQFSCDTAGEVSFYWRASSEDEYDLMTFYLDGAKHGEISGQTEWFKQTYTVQPGTHTLRWVYKKDAGGSSYQDCVWVDRIVLPTIQGFDGELLGGDFTTGVNTPLAPGAKVDFQWFLSSTTDGSAPFWCEVFASKTGGFDHVRFGSTVTNSTVANCLDGTSFQTIDNHDQLLKTIPDGVYSLVPVFNRYPVKTFDEATYSNNWKTIKGKRLRVRNTTTATVDLCITESHFSIDVNDHRKVTVTGTVKNNGTSALKLPGCWIEAFYGSLSPEGVLDPVNTISAGFLLESLNAGESKPFTLNGQILSDASRFAISVIADSTDIIPEINEVNNSVLYYNSSILPPGKNSGVDLCITDMSINPGQLAPNQIAPGAALDGTVTIQNKGTTGDYYCFLEVFASQDGGVTYMRGAPLMDGIWVKMPSPGQTKSYSFKDYQQWNGGYVNSIGDGLYTLVATINRQQINLNVGDTHPLDNRFAYAKGRVSLSTPATAANINIAWSDGPYFEQNGSQMTVHGKVKNTGTAPTRSCWVEAFVGFKESQMGFYTRECPMAGGVLLEGLQPNADQTVSITATVPAGKIIGILADSTDLVEETDESDNYYYSSATQ